MEVVQTEYGLAYLLTAACVLLGLLAVCIPRPRKKDLNDPRKNAMNRRRKKSQ